MTSLTARLADIVMRPVDPALHERAALHLLDWIGCAVASLSEPVAGPVTRVVAAMPAGPCLALGVGRREASAAMLANGSFGNALEMDDIHRESVLHPGPVVIPAALATAEMTAATPAALLDAIVRGYEAMIRLGRATGPAHYRLWHPTSTCGPFGAAAAVASLLGLGAAQLIDAFGQAGTQASGLWQVRHGLTMSKQLHTARAAQSGFLAALLAQQGFTGAPDILEGPQGFFAAMCPDAQPSRVTEPDVEWLIGEVGFKPYPACRHTHAAIDAALRLRETLGRPTADRIERIDIETYASAIDLCDRVTPETELGARFSLQHTTAVALLDGAPCLAAFEPDGFHRADVGRLRERTTLHVAPAWGEAFPIQFRACVAVTLDDGRTAVEDVPHALGDPANPVGVPDMVAKAVMLMGKGGMPESAAREVARRVLSLPAATTIGQLTALLENLPPSEKDIA